VEFENILKNLFKKKWFEDIAFALLFSLYLVLIVKIITKELQYDTINLLVGRLCVFTALYGSRCYLAALTVYTLQMKMCA
jgi:hypothetical protein